MASYRHTFGVLGLDVDEAAIRHRIGPPLEVALTQMGVAPEAVDDAVGVYRAFYREHGIFDAAPYPGVADLLDALAAGPAPLGLATSKLESAAVAVLEHFGLLGAFDTVTGSTADGARSHKHQVVGEALARAGRPGGADVAMVGDRSHDIDGAIAHGCKAIGVSWGYGSRDELVGAGAAAVASSPPELAGLLLA